MKNKLIFDLLLFCLVLVSPSAFSKETPYSEIYLSGDSLLDRGNVSQLTGISPPNKQNPHNKVIYTDQGSKWTEATRATYYSTDQGSRMIPYSWLVALTQPDGSPFASNQLSRYGFLPRDKDGTNTLGLPVGFTIATEAGVEQVGMNCSACHTRQITRGGRSYRIDGGPGIIDIESFFNDLDVAVRRTLDDPAVFEAFRVATQSPDGDALHEELQAWYEPYHLLISRSLPQPNMWGLGRVDALSLIFNRIGGLDIGDPSDNYLIPDNITAADAPVRYPFLWNSQKQDFTQWAGIAVGGNLTQALSRDLGEVYGVFAIFHPEKDSTQLPPAFDYLSANSANFDGLNALGAVVSIMGPPRYPWTVNAVLADRGATVFNDHCTSCHGITQGEIRPNNDSTWATPVLNVRTDIRQWRVILREVDTGVLEGATYGDITLDATAAAADLLAVSVNGAMMQKYPDVDIETLPTPVIPFRYEARVLQGIWAAAPYLHNGSVASLEELLKPSAERMKSFQVGPAYDSQTVGLARTQPQGKRYLRTTTDCRDLESGNSNCGHEYGTTLPPADKKALLEYLKTL